MYYEQLVIIGQRNDFERPVNHVFSLLWWNVFLNQTNYLMRCEDREEV